MPAYIKNDVRKALDMELAIGETLGQMLHNPGNPHSGDRQGAYELSQARAAALLALLKKVPDDEHLDAGI